MITEVFDIREKYCVICIRTCENDETLDIYITSFITVSFPMASFITANFPMLIIILMGSILERIKKVKT